MKTLELAWMNQRNFTNKVIKFLLSRLLGLKAETWIIIASDEKKTNWRADGKGHVIQNVMTSMGEYIPKIIETKRNRN